MNKRFFNYFYFTRSERTGTFILCALIIISIAAPSIHQTWFSDINPPKFIQAPTIASAERTQPTNQLVDLVEKETTDKINYFYFDPNAASKADFLRLGLSPKVSQTILNFRAKGGQFYKATDLKKIYGLSEETYQQLSPYIKIAAEPKKDKLVEKRPVAYSNLKNKEDKVYPLQLSPFDPNTINQEKLITMGIPDKVAATMLNYRAKGGRFYKKEDVAKIYGLSPSLYDSLVPFIQILDMSKKAKVIKSIDINKANIEDWVQLPGIGHYYANLILSYRFALGGFHSIEQVAETYGLKDSTFLLIRPYLIASSSYKRININEASKERLMSHPHLNYKQANAIVTYREQHGHYTSLQTLSRLPAIPPKVLEKITPYLRLE